MRRQGPRPLSSVLAKVSGGLAPATALARVQGLWAEVAGELVASEAEPVSECDGVLTVRCSSSVWAQELELLSDDLDLRHGERALRSYGSQGQQRVGLLALLFAERDALIERGRPPLMLLDDVMSELDEARRERLAELVRAGGQTIVTTTDPELVPGAGAPDVRVAHVLDGHLTLDSSVSEEALG